MKQSNADKTILFGLVLLTLSVGLASIQYASAMSPNTQPDPGAIPPFGTFDLTWEGDAGTDPHDVRLIRVHEPAIINTVGDTDAGSNGIGNCDAGDQIKKTTVVGDPRMWELRHPDNSQPVQFTGIDSGEMVRVTFGEGLATVPITADPGITVSSAMGTWVPITPGDASADVVDVIGNWRMLSCGRDFTGAPGVSPWSDSDGILVAQPVGGEILSLNTSALLIAGLSTSGIWMIPALGAVVGSGLTIYKLRKNI